jgi:hypothetical protein
VAALQAKPLATWPELVELTTLEIQPEQRHIARDFLTEFVPWALRIGVRRLCPLYYATSLPPLRFFLF